MLLDEWSAEQDPTFRCYFYAELSPDMKSRDETVIVISPDDRYLDAADRILRLERGRITELEPDDGET
ncbi:hypothetical protein AB4Z52_30400 [Rhizobium sp. 2YAF20]|uniref:hypothetical protein n=1 Tax=Rhizobium sp. 2YAF20 TaxID=3233027 RepID=UPI003F967007